MLDAVGSTVGTPAYMSPEQARGDTQQTGFAADIYSLGATLYCVLTGVAPVDGDSLPEVLESVRRGRFPRPRQVAGKTPLPLEAICLKALALAPENRYTTAEELAADLVRWLADEPVHARPDTFAGSVARRLRKHRGVASTVFAALLLLTAGSLTAALLLSDAWQKESVARSTAQTEKGRADEQASRYRLSAITAEKRLAELYAGKAYDALEAGEYRRGVGLLHEAYAIAPTEEHGAQASINRRLIAGWSPSLGEALVHDDKVRQAVISENGKIVVTAGFRTLHVWNAGTREPVRALHVGKYAAIAISADGSRVLTRSDKTANVWNTSTGRRLFQLEHAEAVSSMAVSDDGSRAITATSSLARDGASTRVWNLVTGESVGAAVTYKDRVRALAISGNGKVAIAGSDRTLHVIDAATGGVVARLVQPKGAGLSLSHVAISKDGRRAMSHADRDDVAQLWDLENRRELGEPLKPFSQIRAIALSADGKTALTASAFDCVLWDVETRDRRTLRSPEGFKASKAVFSADGATAAIAYPVPGPGPRWRVIQWNVDSAHPDGVVFEHAGLSSLSMDATARYAVTTGEDGVRLWDNRRPMLRRRPSRGEPGVVAGLNAAISADGRRAAVACDRSLHFWDADEARTIGEAPKKPDVSGFRLLAMEEHGEVALATTGFESAALYEVATGKLHGKVFAERDGGLAELLRTREGDRFYRSWDGGAIQSADRRWKIALTPLGGTLQIKDVARGKTYHYAGTVSTAIISDDGSRIALLDPLDPNVVTIWSHDGAAARTVVLKHEAAVKFMAISGDGRRLLTIVDSFRTRGFDAGFVWDVPKGEKTGEAIRLPGSVVYCGIQPDGVAGLTITNTGQTDLAQFWHLESRRELCPSTRFRGPTRTVALSRGWERAVLVNPTEVAIWNARIPAVPDARRLRLSFEVRTGCELDGQGALRPLSQAAWVKRKRALKQLGGYADVVYRKAGSGVDVAPDR